MKFKELNVSLLSWKLRLNVRVQVFHLNLDSAGEKKTNTDDYSKYRLNLSTSKK